MAKLTRQELRIIEQTKRQGEQSPTDNHNTKWTFVKSLLLFILIFGLMALAAYTIVSVLGNDVP